MQPCRTGCGGGEWGRARAVQKPVIGCKSVQLRCLISSIFPSYQLSSLSRTQNEDGMGTWTK